MLRRSVHLNIPIHVVHSIIPLKRGMILEIVLLILGSDNR